MQDQEKDQEKEQEEKEVTCKECGEIFTITESEERFYTDKGLYLPKRCPKCRARRKEEKDNSDRKWPPN